MISLILLSGLALAPQQPTFFGTRVHIENYRGGFLSARNGGGGEMDGDKKPPKEWESMELFDLDGGALWHGNVIALRSHDMTNWISSKGPGSHAVRADRPPMEFWNNWPDNRVPWTDSWELFMILRKDNVSGPIQFKSPAGRPGATPASEVYFKSVHGSYLSVRFEDAGQPLWVWQGEPKEWETFTLWEQADRRDAAVGDWACDNCVSYVKFRFEDGGMGKFPSGWLSAAQKQGKINKSDPQPRPGRVAIMPAEGETYGHVAIVERVRGDKITIRESNYKKNTIQWRTGTQSELKIEGYWP